MKAKIIGILVMTLLIISFVLPIQSLETITFNLYVEQKDCDCLSYKQGLTILNPLVMNKISNFQRRIINFQRYQ